MASSELTEESEDILLESCNCSYATEYEDLLDCLKRAGGKP